MRACSCTRFGRVVLEPVLEAELVGEVHGYDPDVHVEDLRALVPHLVGRDDHDLVLSRCVLAGREGPVAVHVGVPLRGCLGVVVLRFVSRVVAAVRVLPPVDEHPQPLHARPVLAARGTAAVLAVHVEVVFAGLERLGRGLVVPPGVELAAQREGRCGLVQLDGELLRERVAHRFLLRGSGDRVGCRHPEVDGPFVELRRVPRVRRGGIARPARAARLRAAAAIERGVRPGSRGQLVEGDGRRVRTVVPRPKADHARLLRRLDLDRLVGGVDEPVADRLLGAGLPYARLDPHGVLADQPHPEVEAVEERLLVQPRSSPTEHGLAGPVRPLLVSVHVDLAGWRARQGEPVMRRGPVAGLLAQHQAAVNVAGRDREAHLDLGVDVHQARAPELDHRIVAVVGLRDRRLAAVRAVVGIRIDDAPGSTQLGGSEAARRRALEVVAHLVVLRLRLAVGQRLHLLPADAREGVLRREGEIVLLTVLEPLAGCRGDSAEVQRARPGPVDSEGGEVLVVLAADFLLGDSLDRDLSLHRVVVRIDELGGVDVPASIDVLDAWLLARARATPGRRNLIVRSVVVVAIATGPRRVVRRPQLDPLHPDAWVVGRTADLDHVGIGPGAHLLVRGDLVEVRILVVPHEHRGALEHVVLLAPSGAAPVHDHREGGVVVRLALVPAAVRGADVLGRAIAEVVLDADRSPMTVGVRGARLPVALAEALGRVPDPVPGVGLLPHAMQAGVEVGPGDVDRGAVGAQVELSELAVAVVHALPGVDVETAMEAAVVLEDPPGEAAPGRVGHPVVVVHPVGERVPLADLGVDEDRVHEVAGAVGDVDRQLVALDRVIGRDAVAFGVLGVGRLHDGDALVIFPLDHLETACRIIELAQTRAARQVEVERHALRALGRPELVEGLDAGLRWGHPEVGVALDVGGEWLVRDRLHRRGVGGRRVPGLDADAAALEQDALARVLGEAHRDDRVLRLELVAVLLQGQLDGSQLAALVLNLERDARLDHSAALHALLLYEGAVLPLVAHELLVGLEVEVLPDVLEHDAAELLLRDLPRAFVRGIRVREARPLARSARFRGRTARLFAVPLLLCLAGGGLRPRIARHRMLAAALARGRPAGDHEQGGDDRHDDGARPRMRACEILSAQGAPPTGRAQAASPTGSLPFGANPFALPAYHAM